MTASIRECVAGDEAALSVVGQASFLEAFAGVLSGQDILLHCTRQHSPGVYRAWLDDSRVGVWVAELSGGAPVGYLVVAPDVLPLPDLQADDLEVKRIYLLHRVQGTGLGRRLMDVAIAFARNARSPRLLLGVYGGNDRAISFYEHLGFRRVGARRFRVGNSDYDDLIFGMTL